MTISRLDRTKIGAEWELCTKKTTKNFSHWLLRQEFFSRYPNGVLARPKGTSGEPNPPFRVLCPVKGCKQTTQSTRVKARGTCLCWLHRSVEVLGHVITAKHLIALKNKIVKIKSRPEGQFGNQYFIKCKNGCSALVDVTPSSAAKRVYCRLCSNPPGSRSAGFDRERNKHPDIASYEVRLRGGKPKRFPMRRCAGEGCDKLVRFYSEKTKGKEGRRLCRVCTGWSRRKKPYEGRFNSFLGISERRGIKVSFKLNFYAKLMAQDTCHYCDGRLGVLPYADITAKSSTTGYMLDRKDNRIGYTKANVVPCCPSCNLTKNRLIIYEEMLILAAIRSKRRATAIRLIRQHEAKIVSHNHELHAARNIWKAMSRPGI